MSGPVDAVTGAYRQAFTFGGRTTRSELWWFLLFAVIVTQVLNLGVDVIAPQAVMSVVQLALVVVPLSACLARRMHDVGRHRGWALPAIAFLVAGPIFVGFGFAQELVELGAAIEAGGEGLDRPLVWVGLAYGPFRLRLAPRADLLLPLERPPLPLPDRRDRQGVDTERPRR